MSTNSFEKGKWYKNYDWWDTEPPHYMKCISFDDEYIYGCEYISEKKIYS